MKKLTSLAVVLSAVLSGYAQELRINSWLHTNGAKVTIYREWPTRILIDTPLIHQGQANIKLPDNGPAVYSVQLRKPYANAIVFSGITPLQVSIGKDSQMIIKGDASLQKLLAFEQSMKPIEAEWNKLGQQYTSATDMEEKLKVNARVGKIAETVQHKRRAFALKNAGNLAGAWSAYHYAFAWTDASSMNSFPPSANRNGRWPPTNAYWLNRTNPLKSI